MRRGSKLVVVVGSVEYIRHSPLFFLNLVIFHFRLTYLSFITNLRYCLLVSTSYIEVET